MPDHTEALAHRVRRLEAANRVLMALVVVALVVPWVGRADAADGGVPDNGTGQEVAGGVGSDGVLTARRIQLLDDDGRIRIDLRHDDEETGLFILDEHGDTRLGAAQFAHGGGGYALHGPGGRGAAVLYLKGQGSLTMYADDGTVTARMPEQSR